MTHNEKSGVAHFAVDDDRACLALIRSLLSFLPEQQPRSGACRRDDRFRRSRGRSARPARSVFAESAVRHARPHPLDRRRRRVSRSASALRAQSHRRVRAARRPIGRHRRQSAGASRRRARHRCIGEGRAVRAVLRRVQHSARDVRGRARIPARHGAGVRRHHQARCEAAVRVCRGDRAEGDGHHAQGIRRRVLRDVEQTPAHRLQLRMADRRGRGDGAGRRRQRPLSRKSSRPRRIRRPSARGGWPSSATSSRALLWRRREGSSTKSFSRGRRAGN